MIKRILSGGQTGVDRAALDAASALQIETGGWCPRGRKAEDGVIPTRYPLTETPSADYRQRTELNVQDADATLIIKQGSMTGGTAETVQHAKAVQKPRLVLDLADSQHAGKSVQKWINENEIKVLNIAGPRESVNPGIYDQAFRFLKQILSKLSSS